MSKSQVSILRDLAVASAIAREILGKNIISPEEIANVRALQYSEEQFKQLMEMFPSKDTLRWCRANNYAIVACPPKPMSLLNVRALDHDELFRYDRYFGDFGNSWFEHKDEKFARNDKTVFGWLAVRKKIVPGFADKSRSDQLPLLKNEERVPNAGEFAWFVTTYYKLRGVRLFEHTCAWTSSLDARGGSVPLGLFNWRGLFVSEGHRDCCYGYIGLAPARKSC